MGEFSWVEFIYMNDVGIERYTEVTGSSCAGKSTCFENVQNYITGGEISGCFLPSAVIRGVFFVLGFFYLIIRPAKLFWIIRQCRDIHMSFLHKVSAVRNAIEKFGCYLLFRNRAVVVDEGISHIPFVFQFSADQISEFLIVFGSELQKISILLVPAPPEKDLVARLITRGHKKVTCSESAKSFARLNIIVSEEYLRALKKQGKLDVRVI
ncbi:hypothetical protein [Halodesulfovibrio sp. MK-HDV]|uniref:hypothetical protein n=1 Tax=Halodesulfovibrio sp. MK-HDV TaxID=2599925 RepID=UPI00136EDB34|nr:hypothetical protein [Halodesulfovibrio sp. MK-HDV]